MKSKAIVLIMALALCLLVVTGCSSRYGVRGYAQWDDNILRAYQQYELNPEYEYYIYSAGNNYYALLGLLPGYTVPVLKMWKPIAINDPEMKRVCDFLWQSFPDYSASGFMLYTKNGAFIGSIYTSTTFSFMVEPDNSINFFFHEPWLNDIFSN